MKFLSKFFGALSVFILIFCSLNALPANASIVYLTWQRSPDSTMTIHWISPAENAQDVICYQKQGENTWRIASGYHHPLPEGHDEYLVHTVELTNLTPNSSYNFRLSNQNITYKFRTLPSTLTSEIRFVAGGDIYHDDISDVDDMNRQAITHDPHFAILGGDIAYATDRNGLFPEKMEKWLDFLNNWQESMVTKDGYLVPILPIISNEDTKKRYGQTPEQAPFFYALFSMPGEQGYNVLDFGNYMSIWLLDSGHTHFISGKQQMWLAASLKDRKQVPLKFAIYHVPAYPSVRDFNKTTSLLLRKYWVPHFDKYGLTTAFEHHDHAYKRSQLIRNGRVDPNGTLYMGDGGWGVKPRVPVNPKERWYLAQTASKQHVILVTVNPNYSTFYQAIDRNGVIFDEYLKKEGNLRDGNTEAGSLKPE